MDFEKRIDENYSYLTATDRLMVQEIRQNKELVRNMNSTQLARHLGVSRTTLVRMLKKLGISTYAEFQLLLKQRAGETEHKKLDMQRIIDDYHEMIKELQNYDYSKICERIYEADTIYLYGTGNEQKAIVDEFKRIFMIMGKWCVDLFDLGEIEFAQTEFAEKDLFVAVSLSGENQSILRAVHLAQERKIHTLSITRWNNNALARLAEYNLYVGTRVVYKGQDQSYEMIAAFYMLLDILSVRYLEFVNSNNRSGTGEE